MIYVVFRDPFGTWANLRSIIVLPCGGAPIGELSYAYLGMTPLGIIVDSLCVLSPQSALRARMPPALALSLLAMLLHATSFSYFVGVAEASTLIALVFFSWRRFAVMPLLCEEPQSTRIAPTIRSEEPAPANVLRKVPQEQGRRSD
jgi:hypothetical protein